jgi:hypothetical protein
MPGVCEIVCAARHKRFLATHLFGEVRVRTVLTGSFRNVGSAEASGERTRPRVQFPASRRKTVFGETPNTTRGHAYAPQTYPETVASQCGFRK